MSQTHGWMNGLPLFLVALVISAVIGGLFSLLHAYAAINLKSDQTISGTALNMLAPALGLFIAKVTLDGLPNVMFRNTFRIVEVPFLSQIPIIGDLFFKNTYLSTFIGLFILVVSWFFIYKTRTGLRIRACGENPHAADAAGINVPKIRYLGVVLSGVLAGMGGLIYIIPISTEYNCTVAGYGFLALAVLIFGNWKPWRIAGAALFFGVMKTLAYTYGSIPILSSLGLPSVIFKLIPFVATLIILTFTSKDSAAPKAAGIPYDKSTR